jgi:hypothetical protein
MYNLNRWSTFKHTHRSFDLEETVDPSIIQELEQIAKEVMGSDARAVFIQDKTLIENIYNYSDLPVADQFKFDKFIPRKNSQVLAPLLIMVEIADQTKRRIMTMKAGEFYSKAAHHVLERGWQTGFCVCVDRHKVDQMLLDHGYFLNNNKLNTSIPIFCIGHHDPSVPWNFQRRDLNNLTGTYDKVIPASAYITVT